MPRNLMTEERIIRILHNAGTSMTINEIAEKEGMSVATINRWLWHGRRDLKARLRNEYTVFTEEWERRRGNRKGSCRVGNVENAIKKTVRVGWRGAAMFCEYDIRRP